MDRYAVSCTEQIIATYVGSFNVKYIDTADHWVYQAIDISNKSCEPQIYNVNQCIPLMLYI